MEQHAEILIGAGWHRRVPGWRDAVGTLLVLALMILFGLGAHQMVAPVTSHETAHISLSPAVLLLYAFRIAGLIETGHRVLCSPIPTL